MKYDPTQHQRHSIRLQSYDYSQAGAYFVTLCTQGRDCHLGAITDGVMVLSKIGQIVELCWLWLAEQYIYLELDEWVIMPNHLHGVLVITDMAVPKHKSLGRLIGAFKTVSTKQINQITGTFGEPFWQRNYYETIIRSEDHLNQIRRYIQNNPAKWEEDADNPTKWRLP